jgi:hypothetical protein
MALRAVVLSFETLFRADTARALSRQLLLILLAGAGWMSTPAFGDYDVARDFSVSANPSPPWSYGSSPTLGGAFTRYTTSIAGSVDQWSFGGLPNVWHNPSTVTVQQATNFTPPGGFGLHPGSGGEYSIARWTAPASGNYSIAGDFIGLDSTFPTTTDVHILHNNSAALELFGGNIASYNVPLTFSLNVTVAAGDTIEFAVGFGGNGFFGDATGLAAVIAPALLLDVVPPSPTVVTNTSDSGLGSLRDAINYVNANCGGQTITFNIPGTGVQTIHPASALPTITCSHAVINGYSQPGASRNTLAIGNNAVLRIELSGDRAGAAHGLAVNTDSVGVTGLVINRFSGSGIHVLAPIGTPGMVVLGNFIGTDPSGTVARANAVGIGNNAGATGLGIGSSNPGDRNLISGNLGAGIDLHSGDFTFVGGNYIGTDVSGNAALPNGTNGIAAINTTNTRVFDNTLSGNLGAGIGLVLSSPATIKSNRIGTNAAGAARLANAHGITVTNTSDITIGGSTRGDGNVISGNTGYGVHLFRTSPGNTIWGNFIGTDASGTSALGNGIDGVFLDAGSSSEVGCTVPGAGNVIANNGGHGVTVLGGLSAIEGNSIFNNAGLGINLNAGGTVQPNDSCDVDTGGNGAQNYPVLTSVALSGGSTTISGNFDSTPNVTFRIEFFSNLASDAANNRAGRTFLGFTTVNTGAGCSAPINVTLPVAVAPGNTITATATDAANNTGWFSNAVAVVSATPVAPSITVTPTSLAFAERTVGTTSAPQTVTLTNNGPGALQIDSVSLTGDFAFTANCTDTLAAGATCAADVTFRPLAAGSRTGSIAIVSNASGSPHALPLSGTGLAAPAPNIHVSTNVLDFAPQVVGYESPTQIMTVTNDGNLALDFGSIIVSGDFRLRPVTASATRVACAGSLPIGGSCQIGVAFLPTRAATLEGSLLVMGNAPQAFVRLVGLGIDGPPPRLLLVPERLDFDPQPVGTRSAGIPMTITNNSADAASIVELSATGEFSLSDTCTTIPSRADCSPLLFFQPTAVGERTGTFTVRTLAEADPYVVSLAGIGTFNSVPELVLSVTRLGFGNVLLGTATPMALTLSNIGMVPVALDGIVASGDYLVGGDCGAAIAAGASCTVNVSFFPRMRGQQGGALEIRSNAEGSPHRVQLSGAGCSVPSVARSRARLDPCSP